VSDQLLQLAQRALAHATSQTQVTVTRERSLTSRFARSRPTQATAVDDTTVEVLVSTDGHTASATTNALDDDALRDAARRARDASEAAARSHERAGGYPDLPEPVVAQPGGGHDAQTAELAPAAAGAALQAAFTAAAAADLETFGIWTAGEVTTAIASSRGTSVTEAVTDAHMRVIARDADGRSGFASHTSIDSADLHGAALLARAAQRVDRREPRTLPPGEYPVVLEAEAVGTLLDFLAALAFNGLAHAQGRGALVDRLGTRVAAASINLADAPRYPSTLRRGFDFEGVPKRPLPLIQDGVAHAVAHDTRSAAQAGGGARSTGHALAAGGSADGPMPTNLVLVGGGATDEHELAAPIEHGIYVTRLWYVNTVRERETLLTGTTRDGTFLIEDGRISTPLRDVRFTDSALRILAATEALTATPRLVSEADLYSRRFAYGQVCPALRARGFRVTGATV
jgi:predicted Zn-dependent protease